MVAAIVAVLPGVASAAPSSPSTTLLSMSISRFGGGEDLLVANGTGPSSEPSGHFQMTAQVTHLPCPGRFVYRITSEDQVTGAESSYWAVLDVAAPPGAAIPTRCPALPALSGTSTFAIQGKKQPLRLLGHRPPTDDDFYGHLELGAQPLCHREYVIHARVELSGWNRSVSYPLTVVNAGATLQGEAIPECPG